MYTRSQLTGRTLYSSLQSWLGLGAAPPATIVIELDNVKQRRADAQKSKKDARPIFYDGETVKGLVCTAI